MNNFLVDPAREFGYFTAVNPESGLLFGYLFRRTEFRWLNLWEANSPAVTGWARRTNPVPDAARHGAHHTFH